MLRPGAGNCILRQNSNLVTASGVTSGDGTIKYQPRMMPPPQIDNLSL
jgi:hypothetical protein